MTVSKRMNSKSVKGYSLVQEMGNETNFKIKPSPNIILNGKTINKKLVSTILTIKEPTTGTEYVLDLDPEIMCNEAVKLIKKKELFSDEINLVDGSKGFCYWEPNTKVVGEAKLYLAYPIDNINLEMDFDLVAEIPYKELKFICKKILKIADLPKDIKEIIASNNKVLKGAISTDVNF